MDPIRERYYDVVVIGGGVVGCAVLRELTRYNLKCLLIEKNADVGEGISKANSGVIHAGFNVPTGSLKAQMNIAGLSRIYELAAELRVPARKTGKLVVAFDDRGKTRLTKLKDQGDANGTPGLEIIGGPAIRRLEPLARGKWALWSPHTGVISPFLFTIALAESARQNGADFILEAPVSAIGLNRSASLPGSRNPFRIETSKGVATSRWVINCAGLASDEISRLAGDASHKIFPYRGEYFVTDKDETLGLRMPIYPVPDEGGAGLGVHVTPTIDGNILLGPSAAAIPNKDDKATTKRVMEQLKSEAFDLMPELTRIPFIRGFAGIRPKLLDPADGPGFRDFVIEESEASPGLINCIGIESPGLTSAPAIAARVVEIVSKSERLSKKATFRPELPDKPRFAEMSADQRRHAVSGDERWGEMVCRCETVSRFEVERALDDLFGAPTLDAVKRRARCGAGRCQGGFCTPRIVEILRSRDVDVAALTKRGDGSECFNGVVKEL